MKVSAGAADRRGIGRAGQDSLPTPAAANGQEIHITVLILSGDKAFPWSALDAGIAVGRKAKKKAPHEYDPEKNVSRI